MYIVKTNHIHTSYSSRLNNKDSLLSFLHVSAGAKIVCSNYLLLQYPFSVTCMMWIRNAVVS